MARDTIDDFIDGRTETSVPSGLTLDEPAATEEDMDAPTGFAEASAEWDAIPSDESVGVMDQQSGAWASGAASAGAGAPTGDKLQEAATSVASSATSVASTVVDRAKETTQTQLSTRMDQATETLTGVAQAVRRTGQDLREEQPMLAEVTDRAAYQVEKVASYLRGKEPTDLVRDVESFARREPVIFIGGGLALGWFVARFLKSGPPQDGADQRTREQRVGYAQSGNWDV